MLDDYTRGKIAAHAYVDELDRLGLGFEKMARVPTREVVKLLGTSLKSGKSADKASKAMRNIQIASGIGAGVGVAGSAATGAAATGVGLGAAALSDKRERERRARAKKMGHSYKPSLVG